MSLPYVRVISIVFTRDKAKRSSHQVSSVEEEQMRDSL